MHTAVYNAQQYSKLRNVILNTFSVSSSVFNVQCIVGLNQVKREPRTKARRLRRSPIWGRFLDLGCVIVYYWCNTKINDFSVKSK